MSTLTCSSDALQQRSSLLIFSIGSDLAIERSSSHASVAIGALCLLKPRRATPSIARPYPSRCALLLHERPYASHSAYEWQSLVPASKSRGRPCHRFSDAPSMRFPCCRLVDGGTGQCLSPTGRTPGCRESKRWKRQTHDGSRGAERRMCRLATCRSSTRGLCMTARPAAAAAAAANAASRTEGNSTAQTRNRFLNGLRCFQRYFPKSRASVEKIRPLPVSSAHRTSDASARSMGKSRYFP
jgi:hypothetical protein